MDKNQRTLLISGCSILTSAGIYIYLNRDKLFKPKGVKTTTKQLVGASVAMIPPVVVGAAIVPASQVGQYKYLGYPFTEKKTISSVFGKRIHPKTGKPEDHDGIDLSTVIGTPVLSIFDGTISKCWNDTEYGGGWSIRINHTDGIYSSGYAHLSKFLVKAGDKVKKGQIIAYSGNTGITTGPHLHLTVRFNGVPVDPLPLIA